MLAPSPVASASDSERSQWSEAQWFASLPKTERDRWLSRLTETDLAALQYDWAFWSRPAQRAPPGDWFVWLIKAGRGFGKTRSGAEWVRERVESGQASRVALVNDTAADVRGVMIEGPSGLLAVSPPWARPKYEPSKRQVTWPNGAVAIGYAAEAPELLRGPEHDLAWADEPAKWKNLRKTDVQGGTAWDNLMFGLRQGTHPRCCVTTTPRPIPWLQKLQRATTTSITGGSSYANRDNLSAQWYREVIAPYEGTRLGRQELYAEDLEDTPGALWRLMEIDAARVSAPPPLTRIVIAVDPEAVSTQDSAETGIIVAGVGLCPCRGHGLEPHGFVLADLTVRGRPDVWGHRAVQAYRATQADRLVAEVNNGGEMVEYVIRTIDASVSYKAVHASRGKRTRAEPVAALYEQGKVHHVGTWPALEDQLCTWVPGMASPDRMDALVWALTELLLGDRAAVLW